MPRKKKKPVRLGTAKRLKRAARSLIAEHGVEAVTVRDILSAAREKNGAALNYHFGTKEDLIREIVSEQFVEMNNRWDRALREEAAASRALTVRSLIRIIVEEGIRPFEGDESSVASRVAFEVLQKRRHVVTEVFKAHRLQAYDQILAGIALLAAHLPPPIMRQRLIFLTHFLSAVLAVHEATLAENGEKANEVWSTVSDLGNLIDTAVGLILAPVEDAQASVTKEVLTETFQQMITAR